MTQCKWYRYIPADTIFCKGAEPMEKGVDHAASSIFPPTVETIGGAVRAAYLREMGIPENEYRKGKTSADDAIGDPGGKAPFQVLGPFFEKAEQFFVPAPYSWFTDKSEFDTGQMQVYRGGSLETSLVECDTPVLLWAKGLKNELQSLGGKWIKLEDLQSDEDFLWVQSADDFFDFEQRTGIGIDFSKKENGKSQGYRTVREGHLYSFTHARLKPDVRLIFGLSPKSPLQERGCLMLGGEKCFGVYEQIDYSLPSSAPGQFHLSLSMLPCTAEAKSCLAATGKIVHFGGWDMVRGFHKPLQSYYPAGSVFQEKFFPNLIPIRGGNYA